jgi:hypothetical protein
MEISEACNKLIRSKKLFYTFRSFNQEWSRQVYGDLDGDGKIDANEFLPEEIIKESTDRLRIDNIHNKTSMVLCDAVRGDAGKYKLFVQ